MQAGDLMWRVTLLRPAMVDDGYAERAGATVEIGTVWAAKRDVSDAERFGAGALTGEITTRFRVRWSSLTSGLRTSDSLTCEGRAYDIVGIKEVERRAVLEITARARADA